MLEIALILVVMEDALVQWQLGGQNLNLPSLNPCCNGRCTRTNYNGYTAYKDERLNPCCNGRCTRTEIRDLQKFAKMRLNPCCNGRCTRTTNFQIKEVSGGNRS